MNAIACILKTYLRREWRPMTALMFPAIILVIANGSLLRSTSQHAWFFFLFAGTMLSAAVGYHLNMITHLSETDLLPNHRQYHLLVAGGIFTVIFLWSTVALPFVVIPPWHVVALYLLFYSLGLWVGYLGSDSRGMALLGMSILVAMSILQVMYVDVLKSAASAQGVSIVEKSLSLVGNLWPLCIIIISLLSLIFFCRWFLRGHSVTPRQNRQNDNQILFATGDPADSQSIWMASRAIAILAKRETAHSRLVRLLHFGLFSPTCTASITYAGAIIVSFFVFFWFLHNSGKSTASGAFAFNALPLICFITTGMLAFDFRSHHTRMTALYLQSRLPSRKAFADAVLCSYLLTAGKQLGFIALIFAFITAAKFGWQLNGWDRMLQLLLFGFSLSLGVIALSLIHGRRILFQSPILGALMASVVLGMLGPIDYPYEYRMWIIVPVIAAIFLLLYAIRRWRDSEMDAAFNATSST